MRRGVRRLDQRTAGKALAAVIQEAYVHGVSSRSVDDLVRAMAMAGVAKTQVSRLCAEFDERVGKFLNRTIDGDWPYLRIDATYVNTREAGSIVSVAAIVAVAVNTDGRRQVVGIKVGRSEAETFTSGVAHGRQSMSDCFGEGPLPSGLHPMAAVL